MARARRDTTPGLSEFLDTMETRLRILGTEEILAALVAHAKRLPARSRQGFLDIFPDPRRQASAPAQPEDHLLLADIDAFAMRARAGEFDGEEEYDDPFDNDYWDDHGADTFWIEEADALFTMAGEAFLADRLNLAREAYGRLLHLFNPVHQGGADLDAWRLETTDVGEAAARYLRTVYETTPPDQRGPALYREYTGLSLDSSIRHLRLHNIATARRGDLPDLELFLPAWIDALLTETSALSPERRQQLLTEATFLRQGTDGLADLARQPGSPTSPGHT